MCFRLLMVLLCLPVLLQAAPAPPESEQIDRLLADYWQSQGISPESTIDDPAFLRRAYLTVIGRIPTVKESRAWLESTSPWKREELLDTLLESEGFVSHQFNLWADALRLQNRGDNRTGGPYFAPWLKNVLRDNVPYDQWVRELLTAQGTPWENPASAYYLRDDGMPLDNVSNTMQVFLGTRLQCAQCHDHPTDEWTRRDFFDLAAFRYAIDTRADFEEVEELQPILDYLGQKEAKPKKKRARNLLGRAGRELLESLRWRTRLTDRPLRYPDDYQYEDVEPDTPADPHTLFGPTPEDPDLAPRERIDYYAGWVTTPLNLRFSRMAANRLWKAVMGVGAIEPIDDLHPDSVSPVPGLDVKLAEILVANEFDLKAFYRILLHTDFFQRRAVAYDPAMPEKYHFTGPVLRRLSAEQIWDSYAVLLRPDLDARPEGYRDPIPPAPAAVQHLLAMPPHQAADYLAEAESAYEGWNEARRALYQARRDSDNVDEDRVAQLRKAEQNARDRWETFSEPPRMMMGSSMSEADETTDRPQFPGIKRAADLRSPEDVNHWLRLFGQSDREVIDNSDRGSSVNQALLLLNSNETNRLLAEQSDPVQQALETGNIQNAISTMTLGFLGRYPTDAEMEILVPQWRRDAPETAARLAWAMFNTSEFLFLQ